MSVLIFIDHSDGQIKKTSLEALSYGAALAKQTGVSAEAVLLGTVKEDLASLGELGIQKIHQVTAEILNQLDAEQYIRIISKVAEKSGATVLILSHTNTGRARTRARPRPSWAIPCSRSSTPAWPSWWRWTIA